MFYPSHHIHPFYEMTIDGSDIKNAKKVQIWCSNLPRSFAIVNILTETKIITYIFDDDELERSEIESHRIIGFNFVDKDFMYGWSKDQIIRFRILKNQLKGLGYYNFIS